MKQKLFFMLILIFVFFYSEAFAISWNDVLTLVKERNNELKSSEQQMESSRWSYNRAYTNFFPSLSASVSMRETTSGTDPATSKSYSYGLSATQTLFRGMENIYSLELAYSNY